jgi:hypothetical protein
VRIVEGINYYNHLKNGDKTGCSSYGGMSCYQLHTQFYATFLSQF